MNDNNERQPDTRLDLMTDAGRSLIRLGIRKVARRSTIRTIERFRTINVHLGTNKQFRQYTN